MPAAAVIRKGRALSRIIGRKVFLDGIWLLTVKFLKLNFESSFKTFILEFGKGYWNFVRRGKIWRTTKEHQKRRLFSSPKLTLKKRRLG